MPSTLPSKLLSIGNVSFQWLRSKRVAGALLIDGADAVTELDAMTASGIPASLVELAVEQAKRPMHINCVLAATKKMRFTAGRLKNTENCAIICTFL